MTRHFLYRASARGAADMALACVISAYFHISINLMICQLYLQNF